MQSIIRKCNRILDTEKTTHETCRSIIVLAPKLEETVATIQSEATVVKYPEYENVYITLSLINFATRLPLEISLKIKHYI